MAENPMRPSPHRVLAIAQETAVEWTFRIEMPSPPKLGQFYMVSLPRVGEMPISISGVGDGWIDMTIRNVGQVSGAVHGLEPGAKLFLRGPYGNGFPMDEFTGQHVVIAAGGSGVSPVRPIVEHYSQHPDQVSRLDLLFGFRTPDAVLFRRDIDRWSQGFDTILTVDDGQGVWDGPHEGLITKFVKDVELSAPEKMEVIIVGPPVMIRFTAAEFVQHGVPPERIVVSLERRMSCGLGKCGHCKIDSTYICLDGPVFRYPQALALLD